MQKNETQGGNALKKRLLKSLLIAGMVLAAGLGYYAFIKLTGLGIPCLYNLTTGLHCPGCGVSRMCIALLQLDLATAFQSNAYLMIILPGLAVLGAWKWAQYLKNGRTVSHRWETPLYCVLLAGALLFGVLRNLPAFSFLAP